MPQTTQTPTGPAIAPITRLSLYVSQGHNSVTVTRDSASRETTARALPAMLESMNPDDRAALVSFCALVVDYCAAYVAPVTEQPGPADAAHLQTVRAYLTSQLRRA